MLENFKPIVLTKGAPAISFSENGTSFNKTTVIRMEKAKYVVLLINKEKHQLAIKKCGESDENATPFYRETKRNIIAVRWGNRELVKAIFTMMKWEKGKVYKADGEYYSSEEAIIFDLNQANESGV